MKIFKILLISTLFLSAGDKSIDIAKEQEKIVKKVFNLYDSDSSGKLDFKEFAKFINTSDKRSILNKAEDIVSSCDKNKNGTIEISEKVKEEELEKLYSANVQRDIKIIKCAYLNDYFEKIDLNSDSKLTKEELVSFLLKMRYRLVKKDAIIEKKVAKMREIRIKKSFIKRLKTCDSNKDGNITLIELTSDKCRLNSEIFLKQTKDVNGSFSLQNVKLDDIFRKSEPLKEIMQFCDINRDNKLTLAEVTSRKCFFYYMNSEEFLKIDINKDGYLTNKEILKAQENYKKKKVKKVKFNISDREKAPKFVIISDIAYLCNSDKNSFIDKKEAIECEVPLKLFNTLDTNKNGILDDSDYKQMMINRSFEQRDLNKDNMLDFKEFKRGFSGQCSAF